MTSTTQVGDPIQLHHRYRDMFRGWQEEVLSATLESVTTTRDGTPYGMARLASGGGMDCYFRDGVWRHGT